MKKRLLIIGSGGHAGQVIDAVNLVGEYVIVGLIDDFLPVGTIKHGYIIVGKIDDIPTMKNHFEYLFIAIGNNFVRDETWFKLKDYKFATIIHPKASVSKKSSIADGVYVGANATVAYNTVVHDGVIINTNSSLDHDSEIWFFSSLNPNSATGGNVKIGTKTRIGMGVNIKDGLEIGARCKIGMGCTIIHDVPNDTTIKAHLLY
jgi:sugar O-acyltransferase (sialic acid O-acetyltransferase NeuD family)